MTIKEVADSLYGLSVGGYFNGEKFTKTRLETYLRAMMRDTKRIVMEIALPDGWWYFSIVHTTKARDSYIYDIPETRQEEVYHKNILAKGFAVG